MHVVRARKFYLLGALLYAFLIPFPQLAVSAAMILWLLLSLWGVSKDRLVRNPYLLLLPALYFTYVGSMLLAGKFSGHILEHKLSLLVFPVLFFLAPYSREDRNLIYKALVSGLVASGVLCLGYALFRSVEPVEGGLEFSANVLEDRGFLESIRYGGNYFFGRYFSVFHQTVYYAFYLCIGIGIVLFNTGLYGKKTRFFTTAFFLFLLFLISNKAAFIALLAIFIYHIATRPIPLFRKILFLGVFLLIAGTYAWTNPRIKNSVEQAVFNTWELDKNARYGFNTRLLSWDAALELIREKPLWGHGAAGAQEAFNRVYKEKGYRYPLRERLNAHNQFLQLWVENGVAGCLLWTALLIAVFVLAFKSPESRHLLTVLALIIVINAFFESVLNRFSGVSIVSFALCLIITGAFRGKKDQL